MFTHPTVPSSPGLASPIATTLEPVSTSPASPTSRTSRLRGLSYLRNYTQTHLGLSRDQNQSSSGHGNTPTSNPNSNGHAAPQNSTSLSTSSATRPPLTVSSPAQPQQPEPETASTPTASASTSRNRFSLVPALTHPLGSLPPPFGNRNHDNTAPPTTATSNTIAIGRRSTESAVVPPTITTTTPGGADDRLVTSPTETTTPTMTRTRSATTGGREGGSHSESLPSIRFSTFYDPRATRPSLTFPPISRTLPTGTEVIRVGRYSERDTQPKIPPNAPSAAPVGFKSKVVSRRHCEFWCEDGKWYIKDVKSSSGTFLNHIRLSPPGTESKPYAVNDGDIVQLGIDFKGGEEMIFRCVKMRLELNRNWQSKLNTFNMTTHKRLRNMTASSANSASQSYSQDCSICLNSIAPCQCLFVAPCSHTWHYKCIKSLLASPSYPIFICPNCRAAADLEAEVEDPEEWEQLDSDEGEATERAQQGALLHARDSSENQAAVPRRSRESVRSTRQAQLAPQPRDVEATDGPFGDITLLESPSTTRGALLHSDGLSQINSRPSPYSTSTPVPIPSSASSQRAVSVGGGVNISAGGDGRRDARTPSPTGGPVIPNQHEGPITPRNDAGPWVFDGSGVRIRVDGTPAGTSDAGGGSRITNIGAAVSDDVDVTMTT